MFWIWQAFAELDKNCLKGSMRGKEYYSDHRYFKLFQNSMTCRAINWLPGSVDDKNTIFLDLSILKWKIFNLFSRAEAKVGSSKTKKGFKNFHTLFCVVFVLNVFKLLMFRHSLSTHVSLAHTKKDWWRKYTTNKRRRVDKLLKQRP